MENIVVAVFPVESEAYQAFSKIKDGTTELSGYLVSQMAIVKKWVIMYSWKMHLIPAERPAMTP